MRPIYLIGLGRVGAGNSGLAGDAPMSHLAALRQGRNFRIAGLVDPDAAARETILKTYPDLAPHLFADWRDVNAEPNAVIVVSTPPERRESVIGAVLDSRPAIIVIEKPIATSAGTAAEIVGRASSAGIPILVNYHRRFDARHRSWRARRPQHPRAAIVRYGKGLMNYSGHAVDLLCDWYGEVTEVQALGAARPFGGNDWTLSFQCRMAGGFDAVFVGLDGIDYDQLDMDLIAADGTLEWRAGGAQISWRQPVDGRFYRGYRHLAEKAAVTDEGPVSGFAELYQAIASSLENGQPLEGCDGPSALKVAAILDAALESSRTGGKPLRPAALM